jgi:hypothetical protein
LLCLVYTQSVRLSTARGLIAQSISAFRNETPDDAFAAVDRKKRERNRERNRERERERELENKCADILGREAAIRAVQ